MTDLVELPNHRVWYIYKQKLRFQVRDNVFVWALLEPSGGRDSGLLGGILQLRPQSPHLRLLQQGVQGSFQEDASQLLPGE